VCVFIRLSALFDVGKVQVQVCELCGGVRKCVRRVPLQVCVVYVLCRVILKGCFYELVC
jgi:hypothetical protein